MASDKDYLYTTKPKKDDDSDNCLKKLLRLMRNDDVTNVSSAAYEKSHILKASAGSLLSLKGYNSKGSAQWIQVFDSATLPADTAVPLLTFTVATVANFDVPLPPGGLKCANGIVVCNSSTGPTKTIGSDDVFFTAVVRND